MRRQSSNNKIEYGETNAIRGVSSNNHPIIPGYLYTISKFISLTLVMTNVNGRKGIFMMIENYFIDTKN